MNVLFLCLCGSLYVVAAYRISNTQIVGMRYVACNHGGVSCCAACGWILECSVVVNGHVVDGGGSCRCKSDSLFVQVYMTMRSVEQENVSKKCCLSTEKNRSKNNKHNGSLLFQLF